MSDKLYPNLARLNLTNFDRDLNYTGIPLDGWCHPVCLIPLVLSVLVIFLAGRPRGLISLWVLFNIAIIHPMDFLVGTLGIGPRYLVDEYAVLDTRYWVEFDPCVTIISSLEFFVMIPLCYLWYRSIVNSWWDAPLFAVLSSTWQIAGTVFYLFEEYFHNFEHMPANDFNWPPKFDTYLKLKYFWFIGVFCNGVWLTIPTLCIIAAYYEMKAMLGNPKKDHLD